jgi:hypothetical protein
MRPFSIHGVRHVKAGPTCSQAPDLLHARRKLDQIFGEAQPRFPVDRISGLAGSLVTLVRLFPELSRVALCHLLATQPGLYGC